jgi:hypothetical protein
MRRKALVSTAAVAVAGFGTLAAHAEFTLTLSPNKDNTLFEDPGGTISNGAGPHLYVGMTGMGQLRRGAIAFDLSTIPSDATISSVTLTLHNSRSGPLSPAPISLHRFLADWGEGASNAGTPGGSGVNAQDGDVTWTRRFYDDVLWTTPGGDFSPVVSATQQVTTPAGRDYQWTSAQLVADVQGWLANPATNFGWALLGNEAIAGSAERFDTKEVEFVDQRPALTIVYDVIAAAGSTWNIDGGGAWNDPGNWTGGVPDAVGAEARFLDKLTAANAPAVITLGANRTAGKITFDNSNTYEIAVSTHVLTLDNGSSPAEINVPNGTHTIGTVTRLATDTRADVRSRLDVTSALMVDPTRTLEKVGPGTLDVGGTSGVGIQLAPGARLEAREGDITTGNIRGGAVEIDDGRISIKPDGTNAGVSVLDSLQFDGAGAFDLADNDLIVRATAATRQSVLDELVTRIRTARDAAAGRWQGPGLTSSAAEANALTGLAAMTNPGLASFGGQNVGADDVLVAYTYNGDANLDGRVNADDYFRIDSGFLDQPQDPTYAEGDFNYDGTINADDYFSIDSAFLGQTGTLKGRGVNAIAAVPEPEVGALLTGLGLLGRRRRRRR